VNSLLYSQSEIRLSPGDSDLGIISLSNDDYIGVQEKMLFILSSPEFLACDFQSYVLSPLHFCCTWAYLAECILKVLYPLGEGLWRRLKLFEIDVSCVYLNLYTERYER